MMLNRIMQMRLSSGWMFVSNRYAMGSQDVLLDGMMPRSPFAPRCGLRADRFFFSTEAASSNYMTSEETLIITDACVRKLRELREQNVAQPDAQCLRITVESGGCSGY